MKHTQKMCEEKKTIFIQSDHHGQTGFKEIVNKSLQMNCYT